MRAPSKLALAAITLAAATIAAGCGSDDDGGGSSAGAYGGGSPQTTEQGSAQSAPAPDAGKGLVAASGNPDLGRVLVDSRGLTLYLFEKDKGGKSACYGACASVWPPLLTAGKPSARKGAQAAQLGTTKRNDGGSQVTYAGHPLYTYVGDKAPGEANGNDFEQFGAEWYALTPAANKPED